MLSWNPFPCEKKIVLLTKNIAINYDFLMSAQDTLVITYTIWSFMIQFLKLFGVQNE